MRKRLPSLFAVCILACLFSACATSNPPQATVPGTGTIAAGTMQEYSLPLANSGVMRPALDHEGRIWFGEMGHNYLAVFDPKTQNFQQITPPHGASGIMGMTVARDDTIWFAELDANYIGQYNAKTHQFHTYALPQLKLSATNSQDSVKTLPSAPNDVAIDAGGNVWFTEMNADALGKLDPRTGATTQYPISHPQTIQKLDPYGITIDAHGVVWFTETSKGILGRFDPRTEKMRFIPTPNAGISLMEVTNDPNGNIWATAFNSSQLFKFTPATNTFATYNADQNGTGSSGMYGLTAPTAQAVWVTVSSENAIAKFDPVTQHFTYYQIPTPNSTPFGMVVSKDHHIWFTEAGGNKVGMLTP